MSFFKAQIGSNFHFVSLGGGGGANGCKLLFVLLFFFFERVSNRKVCAEPCAADGVLVEFGTFGAFTSG